MSGKARYTLAVDTTRFGKVQLPWPLMRLRLGRGGITLIVDRPNLGRHPDKQRRYTTRLLLLDPPINTISTIMRMMKGLVTPLISTLTLGERNDAINMHLHPPPSGTLHENSLVDGGRRW